MNQIQWSKAELGYESACGRFLLRKTPGRRWEAYRRGLSGDVNLTPTVQYRKLDEVKAVCEARVILEAEEEEVRQAFVKGLPALVPPAPGTETPAEKALKAVLPMEFPVQTDGGPILIAAPTQEQAEQVAKQDGHRVIPFRPEQATDSPVTEEMEIPFAASTASQDASEAVQAGSVASEAQKPSSEPSVRSEGHTILAFTELARLYCSRQVCEPEELKGKLRNLQRRFIPEGFMLLRCEVMDSSNFGNYTILPYGGGSTWNRPPDRPISPRGLASDMSVVVGIMPVEELDEAPVLVQQTAESRTKAPAEEKTSPALLWSHEVKAVKSSTSTHHHWHTECGLYRATRIVPDSKKDEVIYAGCRMDDRCLYQPVEFDPPHSTHPVYYPSLREALTACEQDYMDRNAFTYMPSNMEEVLRGVEKGGVFRDNKPSTPPAPRVGARAGRANTESGEKNMPLAIEKNSIAQIAITEQEARGLFAAMGFQGAGKWSIERLMRSMNDLADREAPQGGDELALYHRLKEQLLSGGEITITIDRVENTDTKKEDDMTSATITSRPRGRRKAAPSANGHSERASANAPWRETSSRSVLLSESLINKFYSMERFPRDRPVQKGRKEFLKKEIDSGRYRGSEWASCHVKETNTTYRMNGKHTSEIFHEMISEGKTLPEVEMLVREYECDSLEDAARLFKTFDPKQSARTKGNIIMGYAVAHAATQDMPPRLLGALTAAVAYDKWGDAYRRYQPDEQAEVLFQPEIMSFAEMVKDLLTGRKDIKHLIRMSTITAMLKGWRKDKKAAREFWEGVRDDVDGSKDQPQRVLIKKLLSVKVGGRESTDERVTEKDVLVFCIQSWNAWRNGEKTVKLKKAKDVPEAV